MRAYLADPTIPDGVALREIDSPSADEGVAVVSVTAASLNWGEVQHVRSFRMIPAGERVGWDVAGVVKEAATDGVGPAVGTPVFGWCRDRGSWAEEVAVPVEYLAILPDGLSPVDASTLGVAALTAHAATQRARRPLDGASVLITGATGGVGLFAIQLSSDAGANVIASLRRPEDEAMVREAIVPGVDFVAEVGIDPAGPGADLIIEPVGGQLLSNALKRVAPRGVIVTIGRADPDDAVMPAGWFLKGARVDGLSIGSELTEPGAQTAALELLGAMVREGRLDTAVARVMPAIELGEAMRLLIDRDVRGKVVISWE